MPARRTTFYPSSSCRLQPAASCRQHHPAVLELRATGALQLGEAAQQASGIADAGLGPLAFVAADAGLRRPAALALSYARPMAHWAAARGPDAPRSAGSAHSCAPRADPFPSSSLAEEPGALRELAA